MWMVPGMGFAGIAPWTRLRSLQIFLLLLVSCQYCVLHPSVGSRRGMGFPNQISRGVFGWRGLTYGRVWG